MFLEYIKYFLSFFILIFVTGFFISLIEHRSNSQIFTVFGKIGLYLNSIIGTPIHEIGHLFFAILSGFKITKIKLFPKYSEINSGQPLGYVEYMAKNNLFNNIASFFVGIGPIISGSLTILILMKILLSNIYNELYSNIYSIFYENLNLIQILNNLTFNFFKNIINLNTLTDIRFYIFILLSTSIACHMSLSMADIKISIRGLYFLLIFLFFLSFIFTLFSINILSYLTIIFSFLCIICSISILFSFLNFFLTYLLWRIFS